MPSVEDQASLKWMLWGPVMAELRNRIVQIRQFGDTDGLEVVDAPLPGGKRAQFYSINIMRAQHPSWFREDLERLFSLLAIRSIRPRIAERISFDGVLEAHRRLEKGGLEGKLVLCPEPLLGHAA